MTREEVIKFLMENEEVPVTHELFDKDEYIYQKNGVILDEKGYLFETFDDTDYRHTGLRLRTTDEWNTGWNLYKGIFEPKRHTTVDIHKNGTSVGMFYFDMDWLK